MSIIKYQDKKGRTLYRFSAYIGVDPISGKQIRRKQSGFLTKKDALLAEEKVKENYISYKDENVTFLEVYKLWLKNYEFSVKERTYKRTLQFFNGQILPYFQNVRIKNIKIVDAQEFAIQMHKKYTKYMEIIANAKRVMKYAVALGIITKNPFDGVIPPKRTKSKRSLTILTKDQVNEQLEIMKKFFDIKWYTLFFLLSYTGLRRGEIVALTWNDIDLSKGTLTINKARTIDRNGREYTEVSAKTEKSNRSILLFSFVVEKLKEYKKWQIKNNKMGIQKIVFPADTKNSYTPLGSIWGKLRLFYKSHPELPKQTVHDFRHTFASLLISLKVDYKYIQDVLGHTSTAFTLNTYVHKTSEFEKLNVEKVERNIKTSAQIGAQT